MLRQPNYMVYVFEFSELEDNLGYQRSILDGQLPRGPKNKTKKIGELPTPRPPKSTVFSK
jgi:hypothetical protein